MVCQSAVAQPYGNEWIDFNQSYFKFKIAEDGIYRISQSELIDVGFPVSTIDPRKIQLFHLGQEVAIELSGQADGVFDDGDYIQFYGEKNDGITDTDLYIEPNAQPHTLYNIFSDTSAYFLTFKLNLETGMRLTRFFENNVTNIPQDNYAIEEKLLVLNSSYYEGQSYGRSNQIVLPAYDFGEGWTGPFAKLNQSLTNTITDINDQVEDDQDPMLEVLLVGGNNNAHRVEILVGPDASNLRSITIEDFNADENRLVNQNIEWSDISESGDLVVRADVLGVDGNADRASVTYIKIDYTRGFDENASAITNFFTKANPSGKSYIVVNNPVADPWLYDITDPFDPIEIGFNESFGEINAVIQNTATSRELYLQSGTKSVAAITPTSFTQINPALYNYLIVTHRNLQKSTTSGEPDPINAYENYRESAVGGGYSVLVTEMNQIFDQFNFGISSPIAIRRFCEYMYNNGNPEFLFFIGKASNVQAGYYRQDPASASVRHLVPTFGWPGADIPFTENLNGGVIAPSIATGRINATSPDHVQAYLNKVIEHDQRTFDDLRRKNLVFLSGGASEQELNSFRSFTDGFKATAENKYLGGEGVVIAKKNNSAVELINISEEVNSGVMMITFFGHSSATVTDIEVGSVSDPSFGYANQGKYPVFLVNGCNAGDFFSENESFGVDWILTPNLGALGFMAHSSLAFSTQLRRYTDLFFQTSVDIDFINKTIGEIKQETSRRYVQTFGSGSASISQVQLLNLQGDPAVKMFAVDKPDFEVDANNAIAGTFDGSQLLASVDSFYLDFDIKNLGISSDSLFLVQVQRTFPDGSSVIYGPEIFDPLLRQDTLRFVIDNQVDNTNGMNTLSIQVDPFNSIDEMNEANNIANFELFLSSGSTFNLLPANNAVISNPEVNFFFQSTNHLVGNRTFDLEIDTVVTFDSPILIRESIQGKVVGQHNIDFDAVANFSDGTIIYWRTKFTTPLPDEGNDWIVSTFMLDRTKNEGWNQSAVDQLITSQITGLTLDSNTGLWSFLSQMESLDVQIFGASHPVGMLEDTKVLLSGQNYFLTTSINDPGCRDNTINFMALKRQSIVPFKPLPTSGADVLNSLVCGLVPQTIYNFTPADFSGAVNPEDYIDALENGDHVLIFSLGTLGYSGWTDSFKTKLETLGINRTTLDNLEDGEPLIILGAKNSAANSATVILATTTPKDEQLLNLTENVVGNFDTGKINSTKIGPALSWGTVDVNVTPSANPGDDQQVITIYGIDRQNMRTQLLQSDTETSFDLSGTDPDQYPNVELELLVSDNVAFSPPQLVGWEVSYQTAPEGILLSSDQAGIANPAEKDEGEPFNSTFTFWNFSAKDFQDSVAIIYDLRNEGSGSILSDTLRIAGVKQNDSINFLLEFSTIKNLGENGLTIFVNKADEQEVYLSNNSMRIPGFLMVNPDATNPILEVSFDGNFIMDGDIVSPTPFVQVRLTDENQFLLKQDTTGINMYIRYPCEGCDFVRIAFSDPRVNWTPASENSQFEAGFKSDKLEDGLHAFRVQATDASGNESGLEPFEINFEVINESTITNFYPYPNPFSTSTQFVFTLTGAEIPEDIKIQIMTISGRIVKEIFMVDMGPIFIGNNRTEYAWDGRDNYGDELANGVYLYRVMIKNAGENFEHRQTAGDRGFKHGLGKMYILR